MYELIYKNENTIVTKTLSSEKVSDELKTIQGKYQIVSLTDITIKLY